MFIKKDENIEEIDIPISEGDLELFNSLVYSGSKFTWGFISEKGTQVTVSFIEEEED